jgi:hypothetical protein
MSALVKNRPPLYRNDVMNKNDHISSKCEYYSCWGEGVIEGGERGTRRHVVSRLLFSRKTCGCECVGCVTGCNRFLLGFMVVGVRCVGTFVGCW